MTVALDLSPDPDVVTCRYQAPKLAVDSQVEQGEFSNSLLHLQPDAQSPDVLELERRLLPNDLALVPWLVMNGAGVGSHDGLPSS